MQKVYLLKPTKLGEAIMMDNPVYFDAVIVKADCIKNARAICSTLTAEDKLLRGFWTNSKLSTCRNIMGCGDDNSVMLFDAV